MKHSIRKLSTPEDIELLSNVANEIWHEYFPFLLEEGQIEYMLDKFLSPQVLTENMAEGYELYLVEDETDNVVGFFVIHPEDSRLFLSKIYLYEKYRNQNISSEMFDFIESRTKELGLDKIYLTVNKYNKMPINIYKHKGFKTVDSVVTDIGGGYVMDDFIMEKQL